MGKLLIVALMCELATALLFRPALLAVPPARGQAAR
jgi:hypothetical protein